jgi:hypothetical protein
VPSVELDKNDGDLLPLRGTDNRPASVKKWLRGLRPKVGASRCNRRLLRLHEGGDLVTVGWVF